MNPDMALPTDRHPGADIKKQLASSEPMVDIPAAAFEADFANWAFKQELPTQIIVTTRAPFLRNPLERSPSA